MHGVGTNSAAVMAALIAFCVTAGCGRGGTPVITGNADGAEMARQTAATTVTPASVTRPAPQLPKPIDPMVVLHTSAGDITIRLFQEKAPRTVENFLRAYAERGFYDQTIFHHAEPGLMLIGGGYTADLQRKQPRAPIYNESRNGLSNRRGTVAMIRDADAPHSATSEFFVNLADNMDFDFRTADEEEMPGYCVFGEVIAGMDIVDRIAQLPTVSQGEFEKVPSPNVSIASVERLQ